MKKIFSIVFIFSLLINFAIAQNAADQIKKAGDELTKKNYKGAQKNLMDAMASINKLMAKEILDSLPKKIDNLKMMDGMDQQNSTSNFNSGFSVNRTFNDDNGHSLNITIIENSPITLSVKMMLKDSTLLPPNSEQKIFYLNGFKTLKHFSKDDMMCNYQIALDSSIIMISLDGYDDETACDVIAQKINLLKIRSALGE